MKNLLLSIWVGFNLSLASVDSHGQAMPDVTADTIAVLSPLGDTLPTITMKFEPAYILACLIISGAALFTGGHSYKINDKKYFLASSVSPYFDATQNKLIADLYEKHRRNRTIWYVATGLGQVVVTVGIIQRLSVFYFIPVYDSSNNNYLFWAGGLVLGGVAARIVCFRNLRKAVNYYNYQYAGKRPAMSLNLGLPSSTPAGLGLYVKF